MRFLKNNILTILGWTVFFSSFFAYFGTFDEFKLEKFFNGDILGIPALFEDIFKNDGKLKDWYLASAPCVFPDFFLYGILNFLLNFNFKAILFFYGLIQTSLVVLLSCGVLKKALPQHLQQYIWLTPVFYSLTFLEAYYFTHHDFFSSIFVYPGFHIGQFLVALICLNIYLGKLSPVLKYTLIFIIGMIATFNDLLFVVNFTAPFLVAIFITRSNREWKFKVLTIVIMALATALGIFIYRSLNESDMAHFNSPNRIYAFSDIVPSWEMFYDQMKTYTILLPGFRALQLMIAFLLPVFCFIFYLVKRKNMDERYKFLLVYYPAFAFIVFATPIINGSYTGWDIPRYFLSAIVFAMAMFAPFFGSVIGRIKVSKRAQTGILLVIPVLFIILNLMAFSPAKLNNYFNYYPEKAKELDSICASNNFKYGVANYWNTKRYNLFSKKGIFINSIYADGAAHEFASNVNWFYDKTYNFIIAEKLDTASIARRYTILDTINSPNFLIFRVKEFYFPHNDYLPKLVDTLSIK
jgi:hypothetical protein